MGASNLGITPAHFTINELVSLSMYLKTLQLRLLATIQILGHVQDCNTVDDLYQWEINPSNLQVAKSNDRIVLSEEMRLILSVPQPYETNEPEDIILDLSLPDKFSHEKRQMMAVVAYMICFSSNPYLGQRFFDKVVMSHDWENKYWSSDRIFSFSDDESNRPDGYYQSKTIEFWESLKRTDLPEILKKYFTEESSDVADEIIGKVFDTFSMLNTSPKSGIKMYLWNNSNMPFLLSDKKYLLTPDFNIIGYAAQRTENGRQDLFLHNTSNYVWEVITASGKTINIKPNTEMPVRQGMAISIPNLGRCWSVERNV